MQNTGPAIVHSHGERFQQLRLRWNHCTDSPPHGTTVATEAVYESENNDTMQRRVVTRHGLSQLESTDPK